MNYKETEMPDVTTEPVDIAATMHAVQETSLLLKVAQEMDTLGGPVPDAYTKAQLALNTLLAVLASHEPHQSAPPVPEEPPVEPPPETPLRELE